MNEEIRFGVELRQSNELEASISHFAELASKYPDHLRILLELSIAQRLDGQFDQSIATTERILTIDNDHRPAQLARLDTLIQQRSLSAAQQAVDALLVNYPQDPTILTKKAIVLRLAGKSEEAVTHLRAALKEHPRQLSMSIELSVCLRLVGKHNESLQVLDTILASEPNARGALFARIDTLMHAQNFEAAVDGARLARERLPMETEAVLRHAMALRQGGDATAARTEIENLLLAADVDPIPTDVERRLRLELHRCCIDMHDLRSASAGIERALRNFPKNQDVYAQVITCARLALNISRALDLCDQALDIWPGNLRFEREQVSMLIAAGDLMAAGRVLDASRSGHADLRIRLFISQRQFSKAHGCLNELNPSEKTSNYLRDRLEVQIFRSEGRTKTARAKLEKLLEIDSEIPDAAAALINILASTGEHLDALDFARGLPASVTSKNNFQLAYANARQLSGDIVRATEIAVHLARNSMSALESIKRLVTTAGQWGFGTIASRHVMTELDHLLMDLANRLPDITLTILNLHRAVGTGDWNTALALSEKACAVSPRDLTLRIHLARATMELGDQDRAIKIVDSVLLRSPTMQAAIELREVLFFAQGDIKNGLSFLIDKLSRGEMALSPKVGNYFLFSRRGEDLQHILEKELQHMGQDAPLWLRNLKNLIDGKPRENATSGISHPRYLRLTEQDLAGLYSDDGTDHTDPMHLLPEAIAAWSLQKGPEQHCMPWIKQAIRATHAFQTILRRNCVDGCHLPLEMTDGLREVQKRLHNREPTLLVGSHSGIPNLISLTPHLPNLTYLTDAAPTDPTLLDRYDCISVAEGQAAVQLIKRLRNGGSVYATPDFPMELKLHASISTAATGKLFGVTCRLVDTIPKISYALKLATYWVQPHIVAGNIIPDVRRMSDVLPNEGQSEWLVRWSQEYLDLIANLLTSGAENQNLLSPMNRYLTMMQPRLSES